MITIDFKNVSKVYRKGPKVIPTLREWIDFVSKRKFVLKGNNFYALKDFSFSVKQGEIIGFIGNNGAGKSTILKLIAKVTQPSQGEIVTQGKIGGILDLGAGFHPELTGRENIFFNGAILGMSKKEIKSEEKEIIAFSELEDFIDTPVKYYSAGMFARLSFSVAIHQDPDILLIDEVLSVGDAGFQDKCINLVEKIFHNQNKTIIFVSHNLSYINQLCHRVIWLDKGEAIDIGSPENVINQYLKAVKKE